MRFSIGKLMSLVALCAVNFFLMGKIGSDPRSYGVPEYFGELVILGGLPMLDLLGVLALIRRPGHRGLDDFLIGGVLALMLYLGVAWVGAGEIRPVLIGLLEVIAPFGEPRLARTIWRLTVVVLVNVLPQVGVASLLRRPIRTIRGREAAQATPGPRPTL